MTFSTKNLNFLLKKKSCQQLNSIKMQYCKLKRLEHRFGMIKYDISIAKRLNKTAVRTVA